MPKPVKLAVPTRWAVEGLLPPVCLVSGRPTNGRTETRRILFGAIETRPSGAGGRGELIAKPSLSSMAAATVPISEEGVRLLRRSLWVLLAWLASFAASMVFVPIGGPFLHERIGASAGVLVVGWILVSLVGLFVSAFRRRWLKVYLVPCPDGRTLVAVPSAEAATAIRAAIVSAGETIPALCKTCEAVVPGEFNWGDGARHFCAAHATK
ncbi:MAG: hypothetical protein K8T90_03605 [Planctomycetes bacterium]|nr:hypothetical protein [Planctomycetota bacterium]